MGRSTKPDGCFRLAKIPIEHEFMQVLAYALLGIVGVDK